MSFNMEREVEREEKWEDGTYTPVLPDVKVPIVDRRD
jgi:hypothetical protein